MQPQKINKVIDLESGLSIIEPELIHQAQLTDDGLLITMILTTPFYLYGPAMLESIRKHTQ